VRRALAKRRWAGISVAWDADDGPEEAPAETATVVHVHYHVHIHAPTLVGIDEAARIIQATPEWAAITTATTEATDGTH
jgi:hypothetical protein